MTPKLFSELGLSPEVLKAIDKLGFEQASPIQAAAIPILMQGHDIVGQSQTGSGKTAAFAVTAIEKIDATKRTVQVSGEVHGPARTDPARCGVLPVAVHDSPDHGGLR